MTVSREVKKIGTSLKPARSAAKGANLRKGRRFLHGENTELKGDVRPRRK